MATGIPSEIPLYVEKIHAAALERQSTQELLESPKDLAGSERYRAEARVRKYNDDIAIYAEKINVALKTLAAQKDRPRIDAVRVPDSVSDPQLKKYLLSVKTTIEQLGESRMKDLDRRSRDEKQLEIRLDEAKRFEKAAKKAIDQLKHDRQRMQKQLADLDRTLDERKRQLAPVKPRIDRAVGEQTRLKAELKKLEAKRHELKREREGHERRRAQCELKRKSEKRPEERTRLRDEETQLQAKIDQLAKYEKEHIDFRLKELEKIEDQLASELKQLREAQRVGDGDLKKVEEERERLVKFDKEAVERLKEEEARLAECERVHSQLEAVAAEPG